MQSSTTIERLTRRRFLERTAAAGAVAAVPILVPAPALGRDGAVAPSERINLGSIGVGMMGQGHLRCFLQYPEAQVTAVCDVDRWRRETAVQSTADAYARLRPQGEAFLIYDQPAHRYHPFS